MISHIFTVLNVESNNIEDSEKTDFHNSHSIDTEPEAEQENGRQIFNNIKITGKSSKKVKFKSEINRENKKKEKTVLSEFLEGIPSYEYDEKQIRRNQINNKIQKNKKTEKVELKNNRFLNYYDGFLSIAEHCHKNQISFTRDKCKEYLKESYIIDFSRDCFIPITTNLKPKQFNKYFRYAQHEMKHL